MKHFFKVLVVVVLLTSKAFAQTDPVRAELDHIFQYIDKSQVPSGYLDEYGPQFAEKKWYTGVLADSNFIQFISGFRFLYNDIEQARIYSGAPVLTSLDIVNNTISQLPASNNTPLIFLIAKYATANEDAINLNLFSNNGNNQVLDVPGRTQRPYIQNSFFAACPVLEDAPQKNSISLSYNPSLAFTNCGKTISSVAVDFLKGAGYQTIAPNAAVSYTYTDSSGYKKFAIRVNCTDGSIYYCYSQQFVIVTTANNNVNARYAPLSEVELANPAITIPDVAGEHFGAKVYIRYSTKRLGTAWANKLVKPFIVVEGYDLNDVAPIIDKENYTINSLLEEWELLRTEYDLNKELDEQAGYDLVFVNYFTMDYVENNAKMLEKVIDQLNALKVNNELGVRENNVIMGISFGGIISRYTLAKMTKSRGTNSTETRLLLTYDSPHQGGNVPLGFQHFLYDFGELKIAGVKFKDVSPELNEFYRLSSQPATSQLLLLRASDAYGTVQYNTFFAPGGSYRNMVDFTPSQMGSTPPLYEFKAISQGSQCGTWVMQPGTTLSSTSGNVATARWVAFGVVTVKYKLTVEVKAMPQQGSVNRISYVKMERNIRLFWGAIGTGWKTTGEKARQSPGGLIPYDCVPGGTSSALQRSGGGISSDYTYPGAKDWYISHFWDGVIKPFLVLVSFSAISTNLSVPFQQDIFTTVPINSALDIQNVSPATFTQSYIYPINGLAGSRSVKYIANESFIISVNGNNTTLYNYEHADFTKRQSQWMYNEMENIDNSTINCEDALTCNSTAFSISGNENLCTNYTYLLNPAPAGSNISWTINPSSGIASLSVNPDKSVTLTRQQNGFVTLTGTTTICNQSFTISKQITVGIPEAPSIASNYDAQCGTFAEAHATTPAGAIGHLWNLNYGQTIQDRDGYGSNYFYIAPFVNTPQQGQTYYNYLTVQAKNACGLSDPSAIVSMTVGPVPNCDGGGGGPILMRISPNPAGSSANVEALENTYFIKLRILDRFGNLKKEWNYPPNSRRALINLNNLPQGVYFLKAYDGFNWRTVSFIKQ